MKLTGLGVLTFGAFVFLFATSQARAKPVETISTRLYVNYSAKPDPQDLTTFDLCILDPNAEADLKPGQSLGHTFLAYISTVEVKPGSPAAKMTVDHKIPVAGKNADWGTQLLDITAPEWRPMIVNEIARAAEAKGFDGFFLDTLDSAELLTKQSPEKARAYRQALVGLIKELRTRYPTAKIVVNRGFTLLDDIASSINGVMVESVFQTFDPKTKHYRAVKPDDTKWIERRIRDVQTRRLPVYAVDYVAPDQKELARETAKKLSALGCIPFVTTQELNGTALAPLCEVPRRVLVLFGYDPEFADKPAAWPIDTLTARHLQTTLEWMGFDAEYLDIGKKELPDPLPVRFAGVILDESLALRPDQEKPVAKWLARLKDRGVPVLFAGVVPFADEEVKRGLCASLGITGTMRTVPAVKNPAVAKLDGAMMNAETTVQPRALGFKDIAAPANANVFLSLRGEDCDGNALRFDPVFLASWGGMWLEPYVVMRASNENQLFQCDPLRFLGQWLKSAAPFPAPDTTTRDGRRIFFSQIDGGGFTAPSHFAGHPTCAEVIRLRILNSFSLPVTVSLVEADTRALATDQTPGDCQRYENIARSIFALPQVQVASHSFTHPSNWGAPSADVARSDSDRVALNEKERAAYPHIDIDREIKGSIDYINNRLLSPTKHVELMLWSGDCRPGVRALEICRALGVENMNGGGNFISRNSPGISGIAPRAMRWGDELQIFAATQNTFANTDAINMIDFTNVIDTFQRTSLPRRLKPVDLHYDFRVAANLASELALEKVHEWCAAQPLHPVTVRDYAQIARDAARTKFHLVGRDHWLISNSGQLRTLRIPATAGIPDLTRCQGIAGYKTEGDVTYIHMTGRPLTELVLIDPAAAAPDQMHLVESGADITFLEIAAQRALFTVGGWSTVDVVLAGIPPRAMVTIRKNKEQGQLQADDTGTLKLSLPPHSTVTLTVPRTPYAVSR